MATKKTATPKATEPQKTLMEKIGEQASHLKDEIIAGKDHLVEIAEEKFADVKSTIKKYTAKKKAVVKKKSATAKKAPKKVLKKAAPKKKKAAPKKAKKAAKKKAVKRK
jgi:hypothetical protein